MEHQGWNFQDTYNSSTNRRSLRPEDELVELLWRDGQVLLHSQTHREETQTQTQKQNHQQETLSSNTFLEDQETVSWIQYPLDEDSFETENFTSHFFSNVDPPDRQTHTSETVNHKASPNPQVMPTPKFRSADSSSGQRALGKEQYSVIKIGPSYSESNQSQNNLNVSNTHARNKNIEEKLYPNATSSLGGSSTFSFGKNVKEMISGTNITTDRKRKHIVVDPGEYVPQLDEIGNKSNQRSGSTRRNRAAEVHNLSERKRRDRINERMKALQELIPHSSKTDKASILDDAIYYLKSLQLQVMCMGSGMSAVASSHFPSRSMVQKVPGLVCQNRVQNQVFLDQFGRSFGGFREQQTAFQPMATLRVGFPAEQQSQQPSASTKTLDSSRSDH